MAGTVSQILLEDHSYSIGPGQKGECPKCHHHHFAVKADDNLGKCFHPACGFYLTTGHDSGQYRSGLTQVLDSLYTDCHQELLRLAAGQSNAFSYLRDERGIHPQVIADSMLGAVPAGYDVPLHFQPVLAEAQAAIAAVQGQKRGRPTKQLEQAEKRLQDLQAAQQKLIECLAHRAGWVIFFFTDAHHHPVALRLRQPYTKNFVSFKPGIAGVFGRELFSPYTSPDNQAMNDFLLIVEGEFNLLQIQSLTVRTAEAQGQPSEHCYQNACALGGVAVADVKTIQRVAVHPVIVYDNDSNGAGFELVRRLQKAMPVEASTTPLTWGSKSDLDSYIRDFDQDYGAALDGVKALIADRQPYGRVYSGTGTEFFDEHEGGKGKAFIPRLLGEALLARETYQYTASQLWVYRDGVYLPCGEAALYADAQGLLGNERRTDRINEALSYVQVATRRDDDMPPDCHYINLRNGRLDWQTLDLTPHSAANFSTAQLPIAYDPADLCPTFDAYLSTTFEPEDVPLITEILGWCLIPDQRFERAVMLTGTGANGKSVLLDLLGYLLGEDNISHIGLQDLEDNRFRVAELYGRLANIFADLPSKRIYSSSMFKTLVSGDRITAERKHERPFVFRNRAKLLFSANAIPGSADRSYAFYRRWIIVPFEHTFNGEGGNPVPNLELRAKLQCELPGIFNRAVEGLQRLYSQGDFSETPHTHRAKKDYQRANDTVQSFVAECVEIDTTAAVSKQEFYRIYASWCTMQNMRPMSQTKLKKTLQTLVPTLDEARVNGIWHWHGIDLTDEAQVYRPPTAPLTAPSPDPSAATPF